MRFRVHPLAALALIVLVLSAAACASREELEKELRDSVERFAAAVVARDPERLATALSEDAGGPRPRALASSPLVIRGLEVTGVAAPVGSADAARWTVRYRARMSDFPSTLFNCLVEPAVLAENHRLKPYEQLIELDGELVWRRQDGEWRIAEAPPPHQPIGRAMALALAADKWRSSLSGAPPGLGSLSRIVQLVGAADEPNHRGSLIRSDILGEIDTKVTRALAEGGAGFVRERFLPAGGESVPGVLSVVGALDGVLAAWWRGSLVEAAEGLSGVAEGEIAVDDLLRSPVRLHSYEVREVTARPGGDYLVTVGMKVSDLASLYSVAICPHEIPDPRGYIKTIDKGLEVTQAFQIERGDGRWIVAATSDEGVVGYAARGGALMEAMSSWGPLSDNLELLSLELNMRLTLAQLSFIGLDFPPLRQAMSKGSQKRLTEQVVANVAGVVGGSVVLGQLPSRAKCFYLGRKFTELTVAIGMYKATDLARESGQLSAALSQQANELAREAEKVEADILKLLRVLRISVDTEKVEVLLREIRLARDAKRLLRLSRTVQEQIGDKKDKEHARLFELGTSVGMLQMASMMGELGSESQNWEAIRLNEVSQLLDKIPGTSLAARLAVARLARKAELTGHISMKEIEPLSDYDWYFGQESNL